MIMMIMRMLTTVSEVLPVEPNRFPLILSDVPPLVLNNRCPEELLDIGWMGGHGGVWGGGGAFIQRIRSGGFEIPLDSMEND